MILGKPFLMGVSHATIAVGINRDFECKIDKLIRSSKNILQHIYSNSKKIIYIQNHFKYLDNFRKLCQKKRPHSVASPEEIL